MIALKMYLCSVEQWGFLRSCNVTFWDCIPSNCCSWMHVCCRSDGCYHRPVFNITKKLIFASRFVSFLRRQLRRVWIFWENSVIACVLQSGFVAIGFLFSFLQYVCVQYERCVQVSFFTRSQHCDNEFIWKYTLRAACACGLMLVFAHVCLFTHSVYMWL